MQDIIKEYGPAILSTVAIVALVGLVKAVIGTDANTGIVGPAFKSLLDSFFALTGNSIPTP